MEVKVKDTKYPEQAYQLGRNIWIKIPARAGGAIRPPFFFEDYFFTACFREPSVFARAHETHKNFQTTEHPENTEMVIGHPIP